jgi:hypothetical protein
MTGTGIDLQHRLAMLGVELLPSVRDVGELDGTNTNARQGLAYAELISCWQAQLMNSPRSTQNIVRQFLEHLSDQNCLFGWNRWIAILLYESLPLAEARRPWTHLVNTLDPSAISLGQLFGATIAMARLGAIDSATLAMGWLLLSLPSGSNEFPAILEDLCATVITSALDVASSGTCQQAPLSYDKWNHQLKICDQLREIIESVVVSAVSTPNAAATALIKLANQLRKDENTREILNLEIEIWVSESVRLLNLGDHNHAYILLHELVTQFPIVALKNTSSDAWHQLMINALTQAAPPAPRLTLVESKSLPRTGHHYLKSVLEATHPDGFSYCEYYNEPGCCKQRPCLAEAYWIHAREQGTDHLRLVKSHDFELDDPIYEPPLGVIRLVQVRQPLALLSSWLELYHIQLNRSLLESHGISPTRIYLYHENALLETAWQIIDEFGESLSVTKAKEWLASKEMYIVDFLKKWLPGSHAFPLYDPAPRLRGCYVLRYEDLGDAAIALRILGRHKVSQPSSSPNKYIARQGSLLQRRSKRISELMEKMLVSLLKAEVRILIQTESFEPLLKYKPTQYLDK